MSPATMTHRDMLRRVSAGEKCALTERSDRRGLVQLAGHLSLIGLCLWGDVVGIRAVMSLAAGIYRPVHPAEP